MTALLQAADELKRRAATAMNERSSRAHAVLVLRLKQRMGPACEETTSTLCMADLGGSEQVNNLEQILEQVNNQSRL